MEKKNGLVYILCGIIAILAIALGVVLWQQNKKNDTKKEENNTSQKEEFKDLDIEDSLVEEAMRFIPYTFCGGVHITLTQENKTIDDFSNLDKFNMVLSLYGNDIIKTAADDSKFVLDEKELSKYFKDTSFMDAFKPGADTGFDAITKKSAHDGYVAVEDTIIPFFMSYKDGKYSFTSYGTGCTGPGNDGYFLKIDSAKKSDKTLKIYVTSYYEERDINDDGEFVSTTYVHKGDKLPVGLNDKDKFDQYEIVYDISEGNLRLTALNYVK